MRKNVILLTCLLTLFSIDIRAVADCVTIEDGSNMWRLVANIGTCLNAFTPLVESELTSIESVVEDMQEDLHSIPDVLGSKIMQLDADLISIGDVIISNVSVIEPILVSAIESVTSTIEDIHEDLYSESDIVQSKIMLVDTDVLSVGDVLNSQLDSIEATDACVYGTAITQADLPMIISSPGFYRLCGDVNITSASSAITIASNDVVLDLNSYAITFGGTSGSPAAIQLSSGTNTIIRNGTIISANNNVSGGIVVNAGQFCNAHISDITIQANSGVLTTGIRGLNSTDFVVENCQINQGSNGIIISGCSNYVLKGCVISDPSAFGIEIINGTLVSGNGEIMHCTVFRAQTAFQFLITPNVLTYVKNCSAFSSQSGFATGTGRGLVLEDCVALNSTGAGFSLASSDTSVERCIASNNGGTGFALSGFLTGLVVRDCIANSNTARGFTITGASDALLEGCIAVNNHIDGFDIQASGTATISLRECSATANTTQGFVLGGSAGIILKDCLATQNGLSGIIDSGLAQIILDTRSFKNGAADVTGSSTVITY